MNTIKPHIVYIGLGSNLGDRAAYINDGFEALAAISEVEMVCSSIFASKAHTIDHAEHPLYLNAVCKIASLLSPFELLTELQKIEEKAGRMRTTKWQNRELDLDILLFNQWILATQTLQIPHPHILDRRFVLEPLCEIAADLILPHKNITTKEALDNCTDDKIEKYKVSK
jgi:2-amino-4-hydroxy-6-hydroxymethyldihydropteridine diphosphokinase